MTRVKGALKVEGEGSPVVTVTTMWSAEKVTIEVGESPVLVLVADASGVIKVSNLIHSASVQRGVLMQFASCSGR